MEWNIWDRCCRNHNIYGSLLMIVRYLAFFLVKFIEVDYMFGLKWDFRVSGFKFRVSFTPSKLDFCSDFCVNPCLGCKEICSDHRWSQEASPLPPWNCCSSVIYLSHLIFFSQFLRINQYLELMFFRFLEQ